MKTQKVLRVITRKVKLKIIKVLRVKRALTQKQLKVVRKKKIQKVLKAIQLKIRIKDQIILQFFLMTTNMITQVA